MTDHAARVQQAVEVLAHSLEDLSMAPVDIVDVQEVGQDARRTAHIVASVGRIKALTLSLPNSFLSDMANVVVGQETDDSGLGDIAKEIANIGAGAILAHFAADGLGSPTYALELPSVTQGHHMASGGLDRAAFSIDGAYVEIALEWATEG